jgi:hypothetical protein
MPQQVTIIIKSETDDQIIGEASVTLNSHQDLAAFASAMCNEEVAAEAWLKDQLQ